MITTVEIVNERCIILDDVHYDEAYEVFEWTSSSYGILSHEEVTSDLTRIVARVSEEEITRVVNHFRAMCCPFLDGTDLIPTDW